MDFSAVSWWAYLITAIAALAFGILQCSLTRRTVKAGQLSALTMVTKFGLWLTALVVMAIISLPLLVVFAVISSVALMGGMVFFYRHNQREAE